MTLKLNLKTKLTCPKHRKYNPEIDGVGGIKAGCHDCAELYALYSSAMELRERAAKIAEKITKFLDERERDRIGLEA
jgi:hypothetical protein